MTMHVQFEEWPQHPSNTIMAITRKPKHQTGIATGNAPLAAGGTILSAHHGLIVPFAHNGIKLSLLRDTQHGGKATQPMDVANQVADFISQAKQSIHIAIYDFRLFSDPKIEHLVIGALKERAAAGLDVRIVYDHTKPDAPTVDPFLQSGADPAPKGTHLRMQALAASSRVQVKPIVMRGIAGSHLMHNKYIIRDGHMSEACVLMGSANFTIDAWSFQENNILEIASPKLAAMYQTDWSELWVTGNIKGTGVNDIGTQTVNGTKVDAAFAPGEGSSIDAHIASLISSAKKRIKIASMVITSAKILGALQDVLDHGKVKTLGGTYDGPQMHTTLGNWKKSGSPNAQLFQSVAKGMGLVGKASFAFKKGSSNPHNFMHDKVAVVDDTVVTGSFNFSSNATMNAENNLIIHDAALADRFEKYIDQLVAEYGG